MLFRSMKEVIEDSYRVIYLPSKRNKWCVFFSGNHLLARIFGKLFFFLISIIGKLNNEIDGSLAFKDFIKDHLKDNRYDVVIITVPPFNMLQMVDLFHAHECKVVVDVRDLWNNMMLAKDYSPTAKQKFWDFIYEFHIKRWLKRATRLIVITPPFKDVLAKSYSGPIDVIYNGYEEGLFAKVPAQYADKFVFRSEEHTSELQS
mgnify:CR=1 FL=1